jgi:hypothetical protein
MMPVKIKVNFMGLQIRYLPEKPLHQSSILMDAFIFQES